jgi:hypothetical protein
LLEESEAAGKTPEQIVRQILRTLWILAVYLLRKASNVLGQSTKVIQDAYNQRSTGWHLCYVSTRPGSTAFCFT